MGCWNGTCMLSNLPINSGEEVKLILLKAKYDFVEKENIIGHSGYVYSDDLLTPTYFPISGIYDDYGGIEKIVEDWNYKFIEDSLRKKFGKQIKVDGEIKKNWNLKNVLEGIERGKLEHFSSEGSEIKKLAIEAYNIYRKQKNMNPETLKQWKLNSEIDDSPQWHKSKLSFVLVRKDIWDYIVKSRIDNKEKDYYSDGKSLKFKEYAKLEFSKIFNIGRLYELTHYSDFARKNLNSLLKIKKKENEGVLNLIFINFIEMFLVMEFLSVVRRGWMIQPGSGSQCDEWEMHKNMAEKIIEVCNKKIKPVE